jgi:hypothetical protein
MLSIWGGKGRLKGRYDRAWPTLLNSVVCGLCYRGVFAVLQTARIVVESGGDGTCFREIVSGFDEVACEG